MNDATNTGQDLPLLELRCFGAPTALLGGQAAPPVVLWRKHLALLFYLALSPGRTRSRSHLQGLLWPEKPDLQARHSLNQAVKLLRDELGADRLVSGTETLALSDVRLTVDVLQFTDLADRQPGEAALLLRGGFLEGFVLDDAPAFEEWAANERARFRSQAAATLALVAERALQSVHYLEATDAARRALAIDPFSEPAVGLLMRANALSGDIAGALAGFKEFASRLKVELDEHPSRELAGLAERVRSMRWRQLAPSPTEGEPPLVGRTEIHREAFATVEAVCRQGARTLFITGDPGTGRTRLLAECVERLALTGAVIAAARPLESDQDVPWSTLRSLLRAGLLKAPGSAAAEPQAYAALTGLEATVPAEAASIASALADLIRGAAGEQPVAVALDDAHCADGASLAALGAAVSQLRDVPVALLITSLHTWQQMPRELQRLRGVVGRTLAGSVVRLENLSKDEVHELVGKCSDWCATAADRDRLARRLFFETGGNPFLLATLLRGLAETAPLRKHVLRWPAPGRTSESQWPISVPSLARRAIMARVAELDEESARVLQAACIGSQAIDVELVASLTGQPRAAVEDRLVVLERQHFVTFDGERFVIGAPVVADVVRGEALLPGELRTLRNRAVALLESRTDLESRWTRAHLLAATSPGPDACDEALEVAQAALAAGSSRMARRALSDAEASLTAGDKARRQEVEAMRTRLEREA